jgi:hypothetical protein
MMPILGVACTVKRELRKLHTTFGGFVLFHLTTEQLICRINMLLQHYHTFTALSKKLDASFRFLQLQLGTPYNPLTLPFEKWGYLATFIVGKNVMAISGHIQYSTPYEISSSTLPPREGSGNSGKGK